MLDTPIVVLSARCTNSNGNISAVMSEKLLNDPMLVGIILTQRCNARCTHCSTASGPERKESLSSADIRNLMEDAIRAAGGKKVQFCLSGGEPFLNGTRLLETIRLANTLGAEVTCVTNAFWARTDEIARARLEPLWEAGLTALAVSTSEYHRKFVSFEYVRIALRAANGLGLPTILKFAYRRGGLQPADIQAELGADVSVTRFEQFSLLPYFRDGGPGLPDEAFVRSPGLPKGRCPLPVLTVREDGRAYSCCTPGAFNDALRVGDIHKDRFDEIQAKFDFGGLQQILFSQGPSALAQILLERGVSVSIRESYSDECDLCTALTSNKDLATPIAVLAEEIERELLQKIFVHSLGYSTTVKPICKEFGSVAP